jgi:GNAT superfamily N-acetyltransferase
VSSPRDAAIRAFGQLQRETYFDAGSLIPGEFIPRMLGARGGKRENHLIVAERRGEVVGGTFFHLLRDANSAFSSFMGVRATARGLGLARAMHEARFRTLDEVDARPVPGIFIDVAALDRLPPSEIEAERRFGFDPPKRIAVFGALGFRKVDVPYRQPVGGPDGGPLTTLDLLYCPRDPRATHVSAHLVAQTMRAYWVAWLGEETSQREAERLESFSREGQFALLPEYGAVF